MKTERQIVFPKFGEVLTDEQEIGTVPGHLHKGAKAADAGKAVNVNGKEKFVDAITGRMGMRSNARWAMVDGVKVLVHMDKIPTDVSKHYTVVKEE